MRINRGSLARDRFTQIANNVIEDGRLTAKARLILIYMLSRPPGWNTSSEALAGSQAFQKDGRDKIRTGLTELEELGYLMRQRVKLDNGRWSWELFLTETPGEVIDPVQTIDGKPVDGEATMTGFSGDGKPGLITNTESTNTDSLLTSSSISPPVTREAAPPASTSPEDHDQRFEQWWEVFPKSTRKSETLAEYQRAWNSGVSHDELLEAAKGYKRQIALDGTEHRYIASSVAWLQGERWKDKYPPAPVPKAKLHPLQRSVAE